MRLQDDRRGALASKLISHYLPFHLMKTKA